jgi:hypothetical protein
MNLRVLTTTLSPAMVATLKLTNWDVVVVVAAVRGAFCSIGGKAFPFVWRAAGLTNRYYSYVDTSTRN